MNLNDNPFHYACVCALKQVILLCCIHVYVPGPAKLIQDDARSDESENSVSIQCINHVKKDNIRRIFFVML